MNNYLIRTRAGKKARCLDALVALGPLRLEGGAYVAPGGAFLDIGPIYRNDQPVRGPGGALWHANLRTPIDLLEAAAAYPPGPPNPQRYADVQQLRRFLVTTAPADSEGDLATPDHQDYVFL